MKPIEGNLRSHYIEKIHKPVNLSGKSILSFDEDVIYREEYQWRWYEGCVSKIRKSEGFPVKTFRELINQVALVTVNNRQYEMYYRGQAKDYRDRQHSSYKKQEPKTIVYPSICRPERKEDGSYKHSVRTKVIEQRYSTLKSLLAGFQNHNKNIPDEIYMALFQHYGICHTPLIDITQSLRVAATFALRNMENEGYVYVFGLPYPNQSISHFYDLGITLIKLQNICPLDALRPRYQEGFLVGKFPYNNQKEGRDNLARRLVAKFKIDNTQGNFWDPHFPPIPEEVLFPENDPIEEKLRDKVLEITV